MIYPWRTPFILDDSQFRSRFAATPTALPRSVAATVTWARAQFAGGDRTEPGASGSSPRLRNQRS
jgi:hypothetical protein